jgi:hypothetical protein
MNVSLSVDLILYGAMLIGVGYFATRFPPEVGVVTTVTGFVGSILCLWWGILGLRGRRSRVGPIVTLLVLAVALLTLVIKQFVAIRAGMNTSKTLLLLEFVLLVFAVGQLINIFQRRDEGMF